MKKNILILISLIICSLYIGDKFSSYQLNKNLRENYIYLLFNDIDAIILDLGGTRNWSETYSSPNISVNSYYSFISALDNISSDISAITIILSNSQEIDLLNKISRSFELLKYAIGDGMIFENGYRFDSFLNDSILSKKELTILKQLSTDLSLIRDELINLETNTINFSLSLQKLELLFNQFINKYSNYNNYIDFSN